MVILETERLLLRMFHQEDFDEYAAIFSDPEVTRYLGDGEPLSRVAAWRSMAVIVGHWQLRGYGMWAVEERQSGILIGRIGFWNPEGWPGFEIGWTLKPSYWGHGYATEGAKAALNYGFSELDNDHVISLIHPENFRSMQVAQRLGEQLEGKTTVFGKEALIYGISREAWSFT
ncbi:GNAT family N-acetyltransferase [Tolypothrix sp. PCC 7910]|uniref:GNAT family N-acetyltransferase n=1 Tax=Tolypothrix sp. PCC 7910 TaxID=2099387 RepID=UPI00142786FB|nr:GNAT family N-acetyltransferase [Tolypothrix sp. PCC 7910]QIR35668.1 GNAT family N-acetyltransferase [Tolypothrix sp. PCC 7910]